MIDTNPFQHLIIFFYPILLFSIAEQINIERFNEHNDKNHNLYGQSQHFIRKKYNDYPRF